MEDFFSFETKDQHIFFRNENDKKKKTTVFLCLASQWKIRKKINYN